MKKIPLFLCMTAIMAVLFSGAAFAQDVHVTYVTPKGLTVVTAPAGTNMTWMGPTDLNVDGYAFCGWNVSLANVQQDLVAKAVYLPKGGGTETSNICYTWQTLPSGVLSYSNVTSATLPKETTDLKTPQTPMTVTGHLTAAQVLALNPVGIPKKTCVVKWYNGSTGELWGADVVNYGATLPQPDNPCITGLEFTGWDGSWTNITEDRNIVGSFYKSYKVVYMCEACNQPMGDVMIREGDSVPRFTHDVHNHCAEGHDFRGWYDPVLQPDGYTIIVLGEYSNADHNERYGIPEDAKIDKRSEHNRRIKD
ncbi:MAG: hypothetical protein IJP84_10550 [Lachnospiraceae bacterium]|nr:hypothetical protein [Lachnospiraceae bacterium]